MRITKLKIGVYFQAQQGYSFCVYFFPFSTSSSSEQQHHASSSSPPSETNFYRLRDLDQLFFREEPGYITRSGKVPPAVLNSPVHTFRENTGDVYLSASAVGDAAKKLGNYMLAELCTLSREQIKTGVADEMLRSIAGLQWKQPFSETEEDLDSMVDDRGNQSSEDSEGHHAAGSNAIRMQQNNGARSSPAKATPGPQSANPRPSTATSDYQALSAFKFPADADKVAALKRNRSEAELSESAQSEAPTDTSPTGSEEDDSASRPRQRKRLSINTALAHGGPSGRASAVNITINSATPTPTNTEAMEQIRSTLKLKQQQQAIIEARQSAQFQRGPMSADHRGSDASALSGADSRRSSRRPSSPKLRNAKNLTIRTGESSGQLLRGGAMTAPVEPHHPHHPPPVMHPMSRSQQQSVSSSSLLPPPRHFNPAPGKSQKVPSRGAEASRYNPSLHSANLPSAHSLMSPRGGEFPSRELPPPSHMHRQSQQYNNDTPSHNQHLSDRGDNGAPQRSPLPPMNTSRSNDTFFPPPSPASSAFPTPSQRHPSHASHLPIPRSTFLHLAEQMYDQADETARLQHTLRDQIRRSTAMLQTLQSSGQMIEGLVRGHFRDMQVNYGEKFGSALHEIARRVERLESLNGLTNGSNSEAAVSMDVDDRDEGRKDGGTTATPADGGPTASSTTNANPSSAWGFKGGPPSANVNGPPSGSYDAIVKGVMDRLDKLEKGT
ncbi:hypothetical protein HKX48_000583 [Thoreauomyces humboldtii]|nr:hypothetical protein HKX48_000583 [Thoreauomyces humboldtii]